MRSNTKGLLEICLRVLKLLFALVLKCYRLTLSALRE